ncbi:MAG TPA: kelch repeat-containing protein [Acidobacteriota bacterium]|nr:kelch repeat-containing protein [Acidobacteriota bacterium]
MNDSHTIVWTRGPDVPLPRGGYGMAWHDQGVVLAGGTFWQDKKKLWTDDVSLFDVRSGQWRKLAPLPRPLAYGVLVEMEGKLYLLGGCDEHKVYRDLLAFDGSRWVRIGEIPEPLVYSAATVWDGKIWLVAGSYSINDLTTATRRTWIYDPASGQWSEGPSVPGPPRLLHALAAVGDSLYLFGGCTQQPGGPLTDLNDAYRLKSGARHWESIQSLPRAVRAAGVSAAGGQIYLFGGHGGDFLDDVYRYDVRENRYSQVSRLPVPLADTKYVFGDGRFYGATGEDAAGSRFAGLLIGQLKSKAD